MDYVKTLKLQFRVGDLWNVLEMWKIDECDTEFVDNSEKTIAILPDRWWPQKATQERDTRMVSKNFLCNIRKKRTDRPKVGGVSGRSRNSAPSRKGCVVNGQKTKASNKWLRPSPQALFWWARHPHVPSVGSTPQVNGVGNCPKRCLECTWSLRAISVS